MPNSDLAAFKLTLNERTKRRYAFYFALSIIVITTIDEIYGADIFKFSIKVSEYLQTLNLYRVCYALSYYFHYLPGPYFTLAPFFKRDKIGALLNLFSIFLSVFVYSVLKLIYADMRPNYISTALRSEVGYCEKDYGKPSGHAMFSFAIYLNLYRDLRQTFFKKHPRPVLLFCLVMIFPTLVSFSRLYFGVHSINQLALGAAYGIICFLLVETYAKQIKLFILLPIFYPNDFPVKKSILRRRLIVIQVIMNLIHFVAWLLRYLEEGGKESVFEHIVNCLIVKENVELNFSVRLFAQGTLYNLMLSILLGMNEAREEWSQVLHFAYDWNPLFIMVRFGLVGLPLLAIKVVQKIALTNAQGLIAQSVILYVTCGYLMGRYTCRLIEKLGVPLYREARGNEQDKKTH